MGDIRSGFPLGSESGSGSSVRVNVTLHRDLDLEIFGPVNGIFNAILDIFASYRLEPCSVEIAYLGN